MKGKKEKKKKKPNLQLPKDSFSSFLLQTTKRDTPCSIMPYFLFIPLNISILILAGYIKSSCQIRAD